MLQWHSRISMDVDQRDRSVFDRALHGNLVVCNTCTPFKLQAAQIAEKLCKLRQSCTSSDSELLSSD